MLTMTDLEALKTLEEYATLQNEVRARMKDLNAEFGVKPLTPEAQTEWASLDELDKELTARTTEAKARRDRVAEIDSTRQGEPAFRPSAIRAPSARHVPEDVFALEQYRNLSTSEPELLQAYRDGAMFAVDRASYPNPQSKPEVERAHIQQLLDQSDLPTKHNPSRELARRILGTGSPLYLQAFTKYIQGKPLTSDEMRAAAAPLDMSNGAGGYAVPFFFDPTLLRVGAWTNVNPYRQVCNVKTIVGTDTYNGATVGAFTVSRSAEATPPAQGMADDSFAQVSATVCEAKGFAGLSRSIIEDRSDIVSELSALISEAKDTEEESSFSVSDGTAVGNGYEPIGVFGAAHDTAGCYTHMDTVAADGAAAAVDAYAMEAAVPLRFRSKAVWFMNRQMIRIWQALETDGGQLFGGQYYARVGYPQNSPVGNTGLALLNYPIYETPSAPAIVLATDNLVVSALADPSTYYIIERAGMNVEVIPHLLDQATGRPTGQRGIFAIWRNTAKPATVDGGRRLCFKA